MSYKNCTVCGEEKELHNFGVDNKRKDNLNLCCRACRKIRRDKEKGKYYAHARMRREEKKAQALLELMKPMLSLYIKEELERHKLIETDIFG